jgi:hypothetical protein
MKENKGTIDLDSELVRRQAIRCDGIAKVLRIIVTFIIVHRIKTVEHHSFAWKSVNHSCINLIHIVIPRAKNSTLTHELVGIGIFVEIKKHTVNQVINRVFVLLFNDNIFMKMNIITHKCIFSPITDPKKTISKRRIRLCPHVSSKTYLSYIFPNIRSQQSSMHNLCHGTSWHNGQHLPEVTTKHHHLPTKR